MRALAGLISFMALTWFSVAKAVDTTPIKVTERWSVVGVISGGADEKGKPFGIAVLRNNETQKTFTLSIGENLPNDFAYRLQSIERRQVMVTDGEHKFSLNYAEQGGSEEERPLAATFLENYYRSLSESEAADTTQRYENPSYEAAERSFGQTLPRLGHGLKNQRIQAYDLYRPDLRYSHPYKEDYSEETFEGLQGNDSFVVNYDNFETEASDAASSEYVEGYDSFEP